MTLKRRFSSFFPRSWCGNGARAHVKDVHHDAGLLLLFTGDVLPARAASGSRGALLLALDGEIVYQKAAVARLILLLLDNLLLLRGGCKRCLCAHIDVQNDGAIIEDAWRIVGMAANDERITNGGGGMGRGWQKEHMRTANDVRRLQLIAVKELGQLLRVDAHTRKGALVGG